MALNRFADLSSQASSAVLLRDTFEFPISEHIETFYQTWWNTPLLKNIVIVNLEHSVSRIWELISHGNAPSDKNFAFVDCYSQISGWQTPAATNDKRVNSNGYKQTHVTSWAPTLDPIRRAIAEIIESNVAICDVLYLDSVSALLRRYSAEHVCSFLRDMKTSFQAHGKEVRFASVVFGVHEDTHDEQTIRMLEFVSTGIVRLQALPEGAKWNIPVTGSMQVTEKRKNGKVTRSTEYFSRVTAKTVKYYTEEEAKAPEETLEEEHDAAAEPDPSAGLSFRVGVSEEERKARDALILPYTKAQQQMPVIGQSENAVATPSGGLIFIDDDDDAFEGSDPDDDLDV